MPSGVSVFWFLFVLLKVQRTTFWFLRKIATPTLPVTLATMEGAPKASSLAQSSVANPLAKVSRAYISAKMQKAILLAKEIIFSNATATLANKTEKEINATEPKPSISSQSPGLFNDSPSTSTERDRSTHRVTHVTKGCL